MRPVPTVEGLTPTVMNHEAHDDADLGLHTTTVFGTWGGTLQADRWAVRTLPFDEQVASLEASFADRIRAPR